jgi:hypothetical protein
LTSFRNSLLTLLAAPAIAWAGPDANATKVTLDRRTFGTSYGLLQTIANRVAVEVDRLIPGQSASLRTRAAAAPPSGIFCYIGPDAPITLVDPEQNVRIVLSAKVLPTNYAEFVFELAHELAHVKMDARYDNYLVETFAVAVSLRVLKAVGSNTARETDIGLYINQLPRDVQAAVERQDWETAKRYWQSQIPAQQRGPSDTWDFSFAFLGALILEAAQQPVWRDLLDAGQSSEGCSLPVGEFKICRPALSRLTRLAPALLALGYK